MKILTVGGAMIDTIAVIANERVERMTMRNADTSFLLLEEGRKNEAEDISTHCGGGAVNAAVALARLGHDVATLIKLGQDARAETILSRLSEEGVSTRFALRDARKPTGASVLVSAHDRNAAIFTFRGANTLLEATDLKKDAFAADLVYVSSLSNESADCFPKIVELAKAAGALVATNPGIRQLSARLGQFRDVIGKIDILAFNRHEAGALVPWLIAQSGAGEGGHLLEHRPGEVLPDLARRGLVAGGFELSLAGFFVGLHKLGPRWVVVTDGRDGAYVSAPTGILHCPAPTVTVAGTAGAGDAFSSTFAACIAEAAPAEDAAIAAAANASSVLGYIDTQTGLLRQKDLESRIATLRNSLKITRWKV
ncbi:MAG: carbohydrate kinase family protein [Hyphomicrobiaceae bacterium]